LKALMVLCWQLGRHARVPGNVYFSLYGSGYESGAILAEFLNRLAYLLLESLKTSNAPIKLPQYRLLFLARR
jgi:hypothetical protein